MNATPFRGSLTAVLGAAVVFCLLSVAGGLS